MMHVRPEDFPNKFPEECLEDDSKKLDGFVAVVLWGSLMIPFWYFGFIGVLMFLRWMFGE